MFYTLTTSTPESRCPSCKYSLYSLGPRGRCPECGFPFDPLTWVWKPTKVWPRYAQQALLFFGLFVCLMKGIREVWRSLRGMPASSFELVLLALVAPVLACVFWRLYRADRAGRFIAITTGSIEMRLDSDIQRISLADILRAENVGRGPCLFLRNGRKIIPHASFDPGEESKFIREVNERLSWYVPEAPTAVSHQA